MTTRRDFIHRACLTSLAAYVPLVRATAPPMSPSPLILEGDPYALRPPTNSDHYLDTTKATDGAGSIGSPWNKITSARLQSLGAGQALWVRQGSNFALPDTRTLPSGTANSHIIFACYPGESATINLSAGAVVFGGGDYWDLKGFTLQAVSTGIWLGNSIGSGAAAPVSYWNIIDFVGTQTNSDGLTDNCGIIKADSAANYLNIIRGSWSGPQRSNNQACLWFDVLQNLQVIGALVVGSACPIYFKHDPGAGSTGAVRNCIIRNAGRDFEAQRSNVHYINTVFDGSNLSLDASGGGSYASNCTVSHCTFHNCNLSNNEGNATNVASTNNLFAGSAMYSPNGYSASLLGFTIDYSAADGAPTDHYNANRSTFTQAGWKAAHAPDELHGVAGPVTFAGGAGGGGSSAAGWALASGSAGKNSASDGTDSGVSASNLLTTN